MYIRIILEVFEKYKCPGKFFFPQNSSYVSNEQPCLKTTGLYDNILLLSSLFPFLNFIFSAPISFSLFSNISHLFFIFINVLSQAFFKCSRKAFVNILYK